MPSPLLQNTRLRCFWRNWIKERHAWASQSWCVLRKLKTDIGLPGFRYRGLNMCPHITASQCLGISQPKWNWLMFFIILCRWKYVNMFTCRIQHDKRIINFQLWRILISRKTFCSQFKFDGTLALLWFNRPKSQIKNGPVPYPTMLQFWDLWNWSIKGHHIYTCQCSTAVV